MDHFPPPAVHRLTAALLATLAFAAPARANVTFISADAGGDVAMYNHDQETYDKSVHDRITDLATRNYVAAYSYGRDPGFPGPTQGSLLINEVFRSADQVDIFSRTTAQAVQEAPWAYAFAYASYVFSVDSESTFLLMFEGSDIGTSDTHSGSSATWSLSSSNFAHGGVFSDDGSTTFDLLPGSYTLDVRAISAADLRSDAAGVTTEQTIKTSLSIAPIQPQPPTQPQPPDPGQELPEPATALLLGPALFALSFARARTARKQRGPVEI